MNNIIKIQKWLKKNKIDVLIVVRTDEFLSEYIAPYAERLKWASGFSGSAGRAIIMHNSATIFVDGRYTVQVKQEVDKNYFSFDYLSNFFKFLKKNIKNKSLIGLDSNHHSKNEIEIIEKIINTSKSKINFFENNPIDRLWHNQPKKPFSKVFQHDLKYSGLKVNKKISQIKSILKSNNCHYFILTSLDSIAWLLNLRGNDIKYTPFNLAYVIITPNKKIELFINLKKIKNINIKINNFCNCNPIESINYFINKIPKNANIGLDKMKTPFLFEKICKKNSLNVKYLSDPCSNLKAQKNKVELQGARNANIRDGISVTKFLYWLKNKIIFDKTSEISAANKILSLRKSNKLFYSLSFETISAINHNAALPHYRVNKKTNLFFKKNCIYLIDSGGQYFDGTTDITRTVIVGKPTKNQKLFFTRVLKGHIALATCSFNKKTKGSSLDFIARKFLKEVGADYDHGTGHGVGSFSCVHEGPQKISKNKEKNNGVIKEGMILSNEPGYYKKGKYGIRIENLIITSKKSKTKLNFETISWAPYDIDLIDTTLLIPSEIRWINWYHQQVFNNLSNKLDKKEKEWLLKVTQPIS